MSKSVASITEDLKLVGEELSLRLTPKKWRSNHNSFQVGHIVASIPSLILFLPVIPLFVGLRGVSVVLLTVLGIMMSITISIGLVSFGRSSAVKIIANLEKVIDSSDMKRLGKNLEDLLAPNKQVKFGVLMAVIGIIIMQGSRTIRASLPLIKISTFLSIGYAAFLIGTGIYLVLCTPKILKELSNAAPENLSFYPYQTIEFRRIVDISINISLVGALSVVGLTSIFLIQTYITDFFQEIYWRGFVINISLILVSWILVSVPFITTQIMVNSLIKRGKDDYLSRLSSIISATLSKLETGDEQALIQLEKLQILYDQIYKSPNTVLSWTAFGKYISSLVITVIPLIVSFIIENIF